MAGKLTPDDVMAAVEEHMGGPFVWGLSDCCSAPCAAFAALHVIDPMERVRGTYDDRTGARRLIQRMGGLRIFAHRLAHDAGLRSGGGLGAIGLIPNGKGFSLAIGLGDLWAAKADAGFSFVTEVEAAWCV